MTVAAAFTSTPATAVLPNSELKPGDRLLVVTCEPQIPGLDSTCSLKAELKALVASLSIAGLLLSAVAGDAAGEVAELLQVLQTSTA
jgi:hypothetical protein